MEEKNIQPRVIEIVVRLLAVDEDDVTLDANLHDLGADSLDVVELIMACENEFYITIPDEAIENTNTVQQLINLVQERAKDKK